MLHLGSFLMSYSQSIGFILGFHGRYFSKLVSSTNIANLFSQPCLCKYLQNDSMCNKSGENQAYVNMPQLLFSTRQNRRRARFLQPQDHGRSSGTIFCPKHSETIICPVNQSTFSISARPIYRQVFPSRSAPGSTFHPSRRGPATSVVPAPTAPPSYSVLKGLEKT